MHNTNHQGNSMGQILHGCTTTTAELRRAIQHSQESLSALADRFHINVKTVSKRRERTSVKDAPMGPLHLHSTVLTAEQQSNDCRLWSLNSCATRSLFIGFAAEHSKSNWLISTSFCAAIWD
jgi:hypothetical protein